MHFNQLALVPDSFAAINIETGELFAFEEAASELPFRANMRLPEDAPPHAKACWMAPHEYAVLQGLTARQVRCARAIEFMIEQHPDSYLAYFRAFRTAWRYLEVEGRRYWMSQLRRTRFVNRARIGDTEPPRRVDEGARPIALSEWGAAKPWYARNGGYGEWVRERGRWVWKDAEADSNPPGPPRLFE